LGRGVIPLGLPLAKGEGGLPLFQRGIKGAWCSERFKQVAGEAYGRVIMNLISSRGNIMLVKIETYNDGECWCARGMDADIFTQGNTLDELYDNIKEAVSTHFGDTEVKLADAKASAG
jgi:hypothetical protein